MAENKLQHLDIAFEKAVIRTINNLIAKGKTATSKKVRQVYNIKAKELNKHIKIRKANKSNKEARIIATGRPMKLYLFTTAASRKNPKSKVKVKIKKGRGTRPLPHSFIARMETGHINVWIREGAKRIMTRGRSKGRKLQPIKGQYTVSVAQMYEKESDKTFQDLIKRDIDKTFDVNFKFYTKNLK